MVFIGLIRVSYPSVRRRLLRLQRSSDCDAAPTLSFPMLYVGNAAKPSPERRDACQLSQIPNSWRTSIAALVPCTSKSHLVISHLIRAISYRVSTGTSVDGLDMGFSSAPPPLSARFRPVKKWWLEAGRSSCFSFAWLLSPNRANRPRFFCGCGFGSSFNPTSSKPSSGTPAWLSLWRDCCIDDRGVARERRTSRERLVSTERRASSDWRGYVS